MLSIMPFNASLPPPQVKSEGTGWGGCLPSDPHVPCFRVLIPFPVRFWDLREPLICGDVVRPRAVCELWILRLEEKCVEEEERRGGAVIAVWVRLESLRLGWGFFCLRMEVVHGSNSGVVLVTFGSPFNITQWSPGGRIRRRDILQDPFFWICLM